MAFSSVITPFQQALEADPTSFQEIVACCHCTTTPMAAVRELGLRWHPEVQRLVTAANGSWLKLNRKYRRDL
eukprot:3836757-Lingulodinium_polyedra.AAC.1